MNFKTEDIKETIKNFRCIADRTEKYMKTLKFKSPMVTDLKFSHGAAHIDFIYLKDDVLWQDKSLSISEKEFLNIINNKVNNYE